MGLHSFTSGFSAIKLVAIIIAVALAVTGGFFAIYTVNKNAHTSAASSFITDFVSKIQSGEIDDTYLLLSDDLKTDANSSYYTWLFWASALEESSLLSEEKPQQISYSNSSFLNTQRGAAQVRFTYETDAGSIVFVVEYSDKWVVGDYAAL